MDDRNKAAGSDTELEPSMPNNEVTQKKEDKREENTEVPISISLHETNNTATATFKELDSVR